MSVIHDDHNVADSERRLVGFAARIRLTLWFTFQRMKHTCPTALLYLLFPALALAQPPTGEVACYAFNGDATDGSGLGHDGQVNGATLTADRFGIAGKAYAFDGQLDHIAVADFGTFGITVEVSVGMWVRANTFSGNFAVSLWPDEFTDRFAAAPYYGHNGASTIFWDFGDCTNGGRTTIIPYPFSTSWTHFVFTSSTENNRMRIYENGNLVTEAQNHSILSNIDRMLTLGGGTEAGYSHWDGDLDDIVLYDRELTPVEAAALYTYGSPCTYGVGLEEFPGSAPVMTYDRAQQVVGMLVMERTRMQLLDATGRILAQEQFGAGQHTWSYAAVPAGVYVMRFEGASGISAQKVVLD